jgi:DNA polymerase-3 subunit gamma/tau
VLDYEYYFKLTDHVVNHRYADALLLFDEVLAKGFDAQHFIAGLSMHFRDLLVCKDPRTLSLLEVGDAVVKRYEAQAAQVSQDFLYEALQLTNACEIGYKSSGNPRLHVELALLRLSNIDLEKKNDSSEITEKPGKTEKPEKPEKPQTAPAPIVENTPPPVVRSIQLPKPPPPVYAPQVKSEFSLKDALAQKTESVKKEVQNSEKNNPFTQEQLLDAWAALVSHVAGKPRLATALREISPVLKADNAISFPVWTKAQKEWMEKNEDILNFLCDKLQNSNIKLDITVNVENEKSKTPYTHDEKFRFLVEQYPAVAQLKQLMKLDVR